MSAKPDSLQARIKAHAPATLVDVHTHLTDPRLYADHPGIVKRAHAAGVGFMVSNGLEPRSNRQVLELAATYASVLPAVGIYPVDAVNGVLPDDFVLDVGRFDIATELAFIEQCAAAGEIIAVGECGLDGHWIDEALFAQQEAVFERLIDIALRHNLPLIIHTRKRERRAAEILSALGAERVDFHCFGGKPKWALQWSDAHGWYFSIPANAPRSDAFTKMLRELPADRILFETDAPYMAPQKGELNEPANISRTLPYLAELRGWSIESTRDQVWNNFKSLFTI